MTDKEITKLSTDAIEDLEKRGIDPLDFMLKAVEIATDKSLSEEEKKEQLRIAFGR